MEDLAAPMRRRARPLGERLRLEPFAFEALQLVHLLERVAPGRATVGTSNDIGREAARLRGSLERAFPASEVAAVDWPKDGPPEVTLTVFGLGGAFGPLPTPYSEGVAEAARRGRPAGRDFLDIVNHRSIAKFLALRRRQYPHTEPGAPLAGETAGVLRALLGVPANSLPAQVDAVLLPLAGLLARRPIGIAAIATALRHLLAAPVAVRPFVGRWLTLHPAEPARLDGRTRLGRAGALGSRAFDVGAAIGVAIGPLPLAIVRTLLPTGAAHGPLRRVLAFLVDRRFDVDLELRTVPHEVPAARLGVAAAHQLGRTTWLGGNPKGAIGRTRLRLQLVDRGDDG